MMPPSEPSRAEALFTGVRGSRILRSSSNLHSANLARTKFLEVHHQGNTRPFMVTIPKATSPTRRRPASIPPANRLGPRRSAPSLPSTGSRARPVRVRDAAGVQPSHGRPLRHRRRIRGGCPSSGGARAAALVMRELQVVAPARQREHHSIVAGVTLERGDLLKFEGIAIEAHDLR